MKHAAHKILVFLAVLSLVAFSNVSRAASLDSGPVVFSETRIENRFPKSLKFSVNVSSDSPIESATFFFYTRNNPSKTSVVLRITSAKKMLLTHTLDSSRTGAIPSTPIFYYWQVKLASGETIKSPEALVYYDDVRYSWRVREEGNLAVWWHDRPQEFGELVFKIAEGAMIQQREVFGIELEFPIRLIIYNTDEEFAEWHTTSTEFIGGEAFPRFGITAQIVEDDRWQEAWLVQVVPHELSHLYFFQVTYHPLAEAPVWLDEGVAQLNEFGNNDDALEAAEDAIRSGKYLPLRSLADGFDKNDEEKFNQAYDESISAVMYLIETYGDDALSRLFAEYKQGNPTEQAFQNAFGVTFDEFEQGWLEWLGAPAGTYIPPSRATDLPTAVPDDLTPTPMPTQVAGVTQKSTALPAVAVTPSSEPAADPNDMYLLGTTFVCLAGLCLSLTFIAVLLGVVAFNRKKR